MITFLLNLKFVVVIILALVHYTWVVWFITMCTVSIMNTVFVILIRLRIISFIYRLFIPRIGTLRLRRIFRGCRMGDYDNII